MVEDRKKLEIEYYDKQQAIEGSPGGDFEGFKPQSLSSFGFLYDFLKDKCQNKKILDYGCGNGIHSVFLAKSGGEIVAIDLSENQLTLARKRAGKEGQTPRIEFIKMDCEKMDFPESSFDIIFDGGTFSSIDLKLALPELARVLKPDGFLVGIETFGHNPLTNLKRQLNKLTGRRTRWAAEHIFKAGDLTEVERYFNKIEAYFFHLTSWLVFPFLGLPGGKFLLKLLETIDKVLLKASFLKKYAFKIVFIFSQPKK